MIYLSNLSQDTQEYPGDNVGILHPEENTLLITEDSLLAAGCSSADLCQQVMGHHSAGEDHPVLVLGGADGQGGEGVGGGVPPKCDGAPLND